MKDNVTLRSIGRGSSLRFIISPAMVEALNLKYGDIVQVLINGIFYELNHIEPISTAIPMPGRVIRAGGQSFAITVRKDTAERLKLQEGHGLLIDIEPVKEYTQNI